MPRRIKGSRNSKRDHDAHHLRRWHSLPGYVCTYYVPSTDQDSKTCTYRSCCIHIRIHVQIIFSLQIRLEKHIYTDQCLLAWTRMIYVCPDRSMVCELFTCFVLSDVWNIPSTNRTHYTVVPLLWPRIGRNWVMCDHSVYYKGCCSRFGGVEELATSMCRPSAQILEAPWSSHEAWCLKVKWRPMGSIFKRDHCNAFSGA